MCFMLQVFGKTKIDYEEIYTCQKLFIRPSIFVTKYVAYLTAQEKYLILVETSFFSVVIAKQLFLQ